MAPVPVPTRDPATGTPPTGALPADRTWPVLAHMSGMLVWAFPLFGGLPVLGVLAPLAIWLARGRRDAALERHARHAFEFQLPAAIAIAVCWLLTHVVVGWLLLPVVGVAHAFATISAAVAAANGEEPRYPVRLRVARPLSPPGAPTGSATEGHP